MVHEEMLLRACGALRLQGLGIRNQGLEMRAYDSGRRAICRRRAALRFTGVPRSDENAPA